MTNFWQLHGITTDSALDITSFTSQKEDASTNYLTTLGTAKATIQVSSPLLLEKTSDTYTQDIPISCTILVKPSLVHAYLSGTISFDHLLSQTHLSVDQPALSTDNLFCTTLLPKTVFQQELSSLVDTIRRQTETHLLTHQRTKEFIQSTLTDPTLQGITLHQPVTETQKIEDAKLALACLQEGFLPSYDQYETNPFTGFNGATDSREPMITHHAYGTYLSQEEKQLLENTLTSFITRNNIALAGSAVGFPGGAGSSKLHFLKKTSTGKPVRIVTTDRSLALLNKQKTSGTPEHEDTTVYGEYTDLSVLRTVKDLKMLCLLGGDFGNLASLPYGSSESKNLTQRCREGQQAFLQEAYTTLPEGGYLVLGLFTTNQSPKDVQRFYTAEKVDDQRYGFDTGIVQPLLKRRNTKEQQALCELPDTEERMQKQTHLQDEFLGTRNRKGIYTGGKVKYIVRDTPVAGGRLVELGYQCLEDIVFEDATTGEQCIKEKGSYICVNPSMRFDLEDKSPSSLHGLYTEAGFSCVQQAVTEHGGAILILQKGVTKKSTQNITKQTQSNIFSNRSRTLSRSIAMTKLGMQLLLTGVSGTLMYHLNTQHKLRTQAFMSEMYNATHTNKVKSRHEIASTGGSTSLDTLRRDKDAVQYAYEQTKNILYRVCGISNQSSLDHSLFTFLTQQAYNGNLDFGNRQPWFTNSSGVVWFPDNQEITKQISLFLTKHKSNLSSRGIAADSLQFSHPDIDYISVNQEAYRRGLTQKHMSNESPKACVGYYFTKGKFFMLYQTHHTLYGRYYYVYNPQTGESSEIPVSIPEYTSHHESL